MKNILETSRLILREFDIPDAEKFYELNSNWDVIELQEISIFYLSVRLNNLF